MYSTIIPPLQIFLKIGYLCKIQNVVVFIFRSAGSHEFTLQQYLNRQKHILHGYEARKLKHVPKVCFMSDDHAVKSFMLFQTQLGLVTTLLG